MRRFPGISRNRESRSETLAAAHREIAHCALDVHHLVYNELREKRGFWDDDDEGPVTQRTKEKMSDMITIFAELFHNLPALTFRFFF